MAINTISSFINVIEKHKGPLIFRGHGDSSWKLLPTIARLDPRKSPVKHSDGWRGIENRLINEFKKYAALHIKREPKTKIEWMIQAQHHGLPTRLLDWTTNPLKALYFAIENPIHYDVDGKVFIFYPRWWSESLENLDVEKANCIDVFYPTYINNRVRAQDGCFTLFPQRTDLNSFEPINEGFSQCCAISLSSIVIEKEHKGDLLKQLCQLGIDDMTMFPDLDGISKSIKRKYCGM